MTWITCEKCDRQRWHTDNHNYCIGKPTYVYVQHQYYGCDTGCCGYAVITANDKGEVDSDFNFDHCWSSEDFETFCRDLAGEKYADLEFRFDECERGSC